MSTTVANPQLRPDYLDLQQLAVELERREGTKEDFVVPTPRMDLYPAGGEGQYALHIDGVTDDGTGFGCTDYFHRQLGSRLNIPKPYYDRMRQGAPELLRKNVRHWLDDKVEDRMVRTLDGNARAYLSNRYRRLDDYQLMNHLLPVFNEVAGLQFHAAVLEPNRLYIRALLPGMQAEVAVGDIVCAGVEIRNSEIGDGSLSVGPFIWRFACLNGMVVPAAALRKYHTGRQIKDVNEDFTIYSDETRQLDDAAFFSKAKDVVKAALSEVQFAAIVEQLKATTVSTEIVSPTSTVQRLDKEYGFEEHEQDSIIRWLAQGGDLSQWGTVNAITAAAKSSTTFTRQVQLEEIGGKLAALDARKWNHLANGERGLRSVEPALVPVA